jgi:hypothetical protein
MTPEEKAAREAVARDVAEATAWAVVCQDGFHHTTREDRDDAQYVARMLDGLVDKCGPHRIEQLGNAAWWEKLKSKEKP